MADMCGHELPTKLQIFMQKDFTTMKIFQKVLGGGATFFETPCTRQHSSIGVDHLVHTQNDNSYDKTKELIICFNKKVNTNDIA